MAKIKQIEGAEPRYHLITIQKQFAQTEAISINLYFEDPAELPELVDLAYKSLDPRDEIIKAKLDAYTKKLQAAEKAAEKGNK